MPTIVPRPHDPTLEIADTTPPGVDPDGLLSFEAPAEGDALDAAAFADEPWADFDPEAEQDDDGGPVSFGGTSLALADTSTRERWLQSALKALVAPALTVDGQIGPRTIRAVQLFQRRSQALGGGALTVDGQVGPRTLAALERLTGRSAPAASAALQPPASPATQASAGALQVSEQQVDGVTEYTIRGGGDEVRFSYWTPDFRNTSPTTSAATRGRARGCSAIRRSWRPAIRAASSRSCKPTH
ncbi:peptidoglycan-binding domain-containing protein [Nannocystis pusilla]|uniref:Peptidoglycan-binding domain-containing protein n=1 Tax=Nannocystis pusilla TaxID=889268 RepID=A0A9X3J0G6_9BACT|nr:peptidoglycan-binding domain-containing protein [Nannocystis pusilla]MCY1009644.1 peptidoglycan-binding domain-containing protein [Nannocystis pusilla]